MLSPLDPTRPAQSATPDAPVAAQRPQQGEELTQFLTLLTTQIQNQDPLEPLDSTGFVEQLATFSTLEQQVQTNEHLAALVAIVSDG